MADSNRRQRRIAWTLMLLAAVALAFGGWRLYVWRWGQPSEFIRQERSPLLADWERMSERYQALAEKVRRDHPKADPNDEEALRTMERIHERMVEDRESRQAKARWQELRLGLGGVALAFLLFGAGYSRRDRLPAVG